MLAGRVDEQVKPERCLLSPDEYPGTMPLGAAIAEAENLRQQGNAAYAAGSFEQAVDFYSRSVLLNPTDHLVYSNRSACWGRMDRPVEALDDAELCVKLAPAFAKGYLRKGAAEQMLNRHVDAQESFRRGLGHDPESAALISSLRDLRAESGGGLQATLYHVLFVSPHLQMDQLFQVLEDPDSLTAAYVERQKDKLDAQFECLTQTLGVDVGLLLASPVLRDAYDRVTFACGQLLQWAPEAVSRHLVQAKRIVEGLGLALRCGWRIHHGVAKFSANALTILATTEGACDKLRREAVRLMLGGMLRWLLDPTPEPEDPPEDRDVCGCSFLCPRLSAATWLERLFEHGTRTWVLEECERFPDVVLLVIHLCLVVRDERAVPLGLPCLLRLPGVARAVMTSEAWLDLSTSHRDLSGKRDGRRWLTRHKAKASASGNAAGAAAAATAGGASPSVAPLSIASADPIVAVSPATPSVVEELPAEADASEAEPSQRAGCSGSRSFRAAAAQEPGGPTPADSLAAVLPLASRPAGGGSADGSGPASAPQADEADQTRLLAPTQRLGEWMMASLGYLLVFIDDDALFAAHACSALRRLVICAPEGVFRLTSGLWMGLPLLERLSALACQHTAALELLETLARQSRPTCVAMCSLASALAVRPQGDASPEDAAGIKSISGVMAPATGLAAGSASPLAQLAADDEGGSPHPAAVAEAFQTAALSGTAGAIATAPTGGDAAVGDATREEPAPPPLPARLLPMPPAGRRNDGAVEPTADEESPFQDGTTDRADAPDGHNHGHEHEGLGEPSWAECYHELRDELWVREDNDELAMLSTPPMGLVTLGNFDVVASQVPVDGVLTISGIVQGGGATSTRQDSNESSMQVSAVPAVWNPRFNDAAEARLVTSGTQDLGGETWRAGKDGAVVLLLRSTIQRTPITPDWASAVWLCADAGATATIIVNDLPDDGPSQPAFRMGLFGSPPPPISAFMISGQDGDVVRDVFTRAAAVEGHVLRASVRSARSSASAGASSSGSSSSSSSTSAFVAGGGVVGGGASSTPPPAWPLVLRSPQDIAQAWSLVETVHRASPSKELAAKLADLASHMGLPEKRVWLTRRLQRYHRGDTDADEPVDPQLAFVECDRDNDQLHQLRKQLAERTGIAAPDITGDFEVRFREESSVGSAVVREWMDVLAQQAFLQPVRHLLTSYDHGATFLPDPAAPFLNSHWRGDFQLLGRLMGLAFWHQVTLDLPLHPYVCKLLLLDGESPEQTLEEDIAEFATIDEELHRHKVLWLLSNDISALGFEMSFTDTLISSGVGAAAGQGRGADAVDADGASAEARAGTSAAATKPQPYAEPAPDLPALPEVATAQDMLPGTDQAPDLPQLRSFGATQVALVPGGEDLVVTEENKHEFVKALLAWRLRTSMRGAVEEILNGMHAAVPSEVLAEARRMLGAQEVHALLAGMRDIDVGDWERNTRFTGGLSPTSQEARWFWRILRQWGDDGRQDRLQDLLQFATGSRRVPVGGFAQLVGFNGGKHLFTLVKGAHLSAASLPTSHACICTVDLPPWESFEAARQKLLAATEAGRSRFDEGTARGGDGD